MNANELVFLFDMNRRAATINLDGVDEDTALRRPGPDANSMNWILGHIVAYRQRTLARIDAGDPAWDEDVLEMYAGDGDVEWDETRALPLARIREDLERFHERLVETIENAAPDELGPPTGFGSLAFMQFHEAYHVGQLGLARRLLGLPGMIKAPKAPAESS